MEILIWHALGLVLGTAADQFALLREQGTQGLPVYTKELPVDTAPIVGV